MNVRLAATAFVLGCGLSLVAQVQADAAPARHSAVACASDEGPDGQDGPCVWNASTMGNLSGQSFRITRKEKVVFISDHRAEVLLGTSR